MTSCCLLAEEPWSANIRKLAKDHKNYGSAASCLCAKVVNNISLNFNLCDF